MMVPLGITDPEQIRLITAETEKLWPELFARVYPRRYVDTPGYGSPRTAAHFLLLAMSHMTEMPPGMLPTAYKLIQPVAWAMVRKRMPWIFLAPQLAEAVKRTTFEGEIDWATLPLPYECGGMILPTGVLTHPTDGPCTALFWGRLNPGTVVPPPGPEFRGFPSYDLANKAFCIVALCPKTGMWYDSNLTDAKRPVVKLNNLFYTEGGVVPAFEKNELTRLIDQDLTEEADRLFVEQMGLIVFGTFLILAARPELLERERLERTVKDRRHGGHKEFWSPNIIGLNYRLPTRPAGGGTHASPRLHYRRGHVRQQAYGPGRAEHKVIWIEPTVVGAGKDGDAD